jgi:hypothetical protein
MQTPQPAVYYRRANISSVTRDRAVLAALLLVYTAALFYRHTEIPAGLQ